MKILFGALGTARVDRIFLKTIWVVAMIINITPDETGTFRVCLWYSNRVRKIRYRPVPYKVLTVPYKVLASTLILKGWFHHHRRIRDMVVPSEVKYMVLPTISTLFSDIPADLTVRKVSKQNRAYKVRLRYQLKWRFARALSIRPPKSHLDWWLISEFLDPAPDTLFPKDLVVSLSWNL